MEALFYYKELGEEHLFFERSPATAGRSREVIKQLSSRLVLRTRPNNIYY